MGPLVTRCAAVAVLVAGVLAATARPAQAGDPAAADRFEAKGKKAYGSKRWIDAVASFEAAYRCDPRPKFLFNIAKAYEQKGDLAKAIRYAERFVGEARTDGDRTDGGDLLTLLRIKHEEAGGGDEATGAPAAAARSDRPPPPRGTDAEPDAAPGDEPGDAAVATPPEPGADAEDPGTAGAGATSPPADEPPRPRRSGPPDGAMYCYYGAAGLFSLGVVFGAAAAASMKERDGLSSPVTLADIDGADREAQSRARAANGLFGLAILAAGVGAVWQLTDTSAATLSLVPSPGGALVAWGAGPPALR